jgi:hypothetical protein
MHDFCVESEQSNPSYPRYVYHKANSDRIHSALLQSPVPVRASLSIVSVRGTIQIYHYIIRDNYSTVICYPLTLQRPATHVFHTIENTLVVKGLKRIGLTSGVSADIT